MARKVERITISSEGRDKGKVFELTEMPARRVERWAGKAIFALMNAGVDIPEDLQSLGMATLLSIGLKSLGKLPFEMAEPLFDEMMECVQLSPDRGNPQVVRGLIESDIEEISTLFLLRKEIFKLHTDFFTSAN
jgi:hypothetical protein